MQKIAGVLLSIVAIIVLAKATDYCSKAICNAGVSHIACGHTGRFAKSCPSDATIVKITSNLKATLVNAHNAKRNFIAGGGDPKHAAACRMATMKWDNELASIAALNVRQCAMAHDKCRNTDAFKHSGQNLAWMGFFGTADNTKMLKKAVDMWYSEVAHSKMDYINKYPSGYRGPAIGHFTVMVADRNIRVGCAAATYSVTGASYKAYLVACNYATTNMVNFPIYAKCNVAGSACHTGKNPLYPNLCSVSESYAVNKWF